MLFQNLFQSQFFVGINTIDSHRLEGNLHNKMYNIIYKALGNFEAKNSEEREAWINDDFNGTRVSLHRSDVAARGSIKREMSRIRY